MSANQGEIGYLHLPPGAEPPTLSIGPFKAVMILEAEHSNEWRNTISHWLVASGCRYMMAWGVESSEWDNSVDWASIEACGWDVDVDLDDDRFVMTTWHDKETLASVFWFAGLCAGHATLDLETLLIDVGPSPREAALRAAYQAALLADPDEL